MLAKQLIQPESIVVVGGSNDIRKPGGNVVRILKEGTFQGKLYIVNPKDAVIQGIPAFQRIEDLPDVDLAILAIAAKYCPDTIKYLVKHKKTLGFIILSAGFSEEGAEGAKMEREIASVIDQAGGSLIGPNCIGVINSHYQGVFTSPVPRLDPKGCDFISGSGATAVFIMEAGIFKGLTFSSVYSVGNSAQVGVEEVLQHMDETFDPAVDSRIKLLYLEHVRHPQMLLRHASSLIRKGCKIAAVKAGISEAGSRAASSHTGALASPDTAVDALFRKAGIVRCHSREELIIVAGIFMHKVLTGPNIAIITHAGGPAVMLTDTLSEGGLQVPLIEGPESLELLQKLHPGSSVSNPLDFLATGTAGQLEEIIDYCDNHFHNIDGMIVIFGSSGLFPVNEVYRVLDEKMKICSKPIFPVLPSVINARDEINEFLKKGRINFPDEVLLGRALTEVYHTPPPAPETIMLPDVKKEVVRNIIDSFTADSPEGYLTPDRVSSILDATGIPVVAEKVVYSERDAISAAYETGFPVAMKVVGPVHKSDVGGVALNVSDESGVSQEYNRLMNLPEAKAVMIQQMATGMELIAGLKSEPGYGTLVLVGLGGIFTEILRDVSWGLSPLTLNEALDMIRNLKGYLMLKGVRGKEKVNELNLAEIIIKLSALAMVAPEIAEMDINPLIGNSQGIFAVDSRIRVGK